MQYRKLGKSGLQLSELSYGSWVTFGNQIDENLACKLIKTAYDAGVNFFDNAEAYATGESEKIMGNALKKLGIKRDTWCISSKVFWGGELPTQRGLSRKHIHDCCHLAMKRLQVDYLDLYFCHRPDPDTPIEETVRAMDVLVRQGKILYWGTSEWSAQQIIKAHKIAAEFNLTPPTMEQPEYNMLNRERFEFEYLNLYKKYGMGTTIWSPLASGILSGKYNNGIPKNSRFKLDSYSWLWDSFIEQNGQEKIEKVKQLIPIAENLNITSAQLALLWCLQNSNVSTIILGASNIDQLNENLAVSELKTKLTSEIMEKIESILDNAPNLASG